MQVYKLCMSIIKKNIPILSIYIFIFLGVSLLISASGARDQQKMTSFTESKSNIAFISEDNTPLVNGLKEELGNIANFVELPDKSDDLQDALFFRTVSYILRIPKGFTEGFMNGDDVKTEKTVVPDSFSNAYIDLCIDKYLNTAKLYVESFDGITQEELVSYLKEDLAESAPVDVKSNGHENTNHSYENYFFNYLSYSLLSVIVLGMGALMLVFNNRNIRMRNGCSPISATRMNLQYVLGNLTFTFASWLIMILICLAISLKNSLTLNMVYLILNSFVFAFCCASISYLIGNLIKTQEAVTAVCNAVTLGLCFISGAFVPQELLGSTVLKIASFGPVYWFVKANNAIVELTQFDFTHLKPVFSDMLILTCFSLAFFSVALVIGKKRRYS